MIGELAGDTDNEADVAIAQLRVATDFATVSSALRMNGKLLAYALYSMSATRKYRTFEIAKRRGGVRRIESPILSLKIAQYRVKRLLDKLYKPTKASHGYEIGRSIVTNAEKHVGRPIVVSVDIKDFFDNINFGRVFGVLKSPPFAFSRYAATILAQICTHQNRLPQGAPTSPVIANSVAIFLDKKMLSFARRSDLYYTRYSDDISISTFRSRLSPRLGAFLPTGAFELSADIYRIFKEAGFEINKRKVKVRFNDRRQVVSGLVVNVRPNITRRYLRNLRARLHDWENHGEVEATVRYLNSHYPRKTWSFVEKQRPPSLERVVRGQIGFVGNVRGIDDRMYLSLVQKFNTFAERPIRRVASPFRGAVWALETDLESIPDDTVGSELLQGTAFFLKDIGLVTCAHCLTSAMCIYNPEVDVLRYQVRVRHRFDELDLAVLDIVPGIIPMEPKYLNRSNIQTFTAGLITRVVGYPSVKEGDWVSDRPGVVVAGRQVGNVHRPIISAAILGGNSGGPVIDADGRVLGVAVTGADSANAAEYEHAHGMIPIKLLYEAIKVAEAVAATHLPPDLGSPPAKT